MIVLGLMSGTSMDGVDAAVIDTDGERVAGFGPRLYRPYGEGERDLLRAALAAARSMATRDARPAAVAAAEAMVTGAHAEAVEQLRSENPGLAVELVGFHGHTVLHAPERHLTVQIGDGAGLARRLGVPVAFDFRAADVAAGGEGAPLVPVYHAALAGRLAQTGVVAIVNIGGVANLTRIAADGALVAGDTGPGNALLDDFVRTRTGAAMDVGGALASAGRVDAGVLAALLADPWFARAMPKSADRGQFSGGPVAALSTADGAATLAAFTARTIAEAIAAAGGCDRIVVCGGGAKNGALMAALAGYAGVPVAPADDLGWSADFLEAEAFAFLAARSVRGLPLTYPATTGAPRPTAGGRLARP